MKRNTMRGFERNFGRRPTRLPAFQQQTKSLPALDPGALYHYWYPGRDGVEHAPREFQQKLLEIGGLHPTAGGPNLMCVRPPAGAPIRCRCWLVFYRKPEVTHYLSPGWLLVLAWHNGAEPTPQPLPLDERVFANLTLQSLKGGRILYGRDFDNARQYFDHVVGIMQRDNEKAEKEKKVYLDDRREDYYDATKIKNIGHGSKFALHHDGTVFPSRNEQNWLRERGRFLPEADRKRDEAETAIHARSRIAVSQVNKQAAANFAFQRQMSELRVKERIRELVHARRRSTTAGRA